MPTMSDQFNHAKNVVQWKIDQQTRISKLNTQISGLESRVIRYKSDLADQALILHSQNKLKLPELSKICMDIAEVSKELNKSRNDVAYVRNEKPPVIAETSTGVPTTLSGLICPTCKAVLVGQFCPKHGVQGIQPESNSGLFCPICHQQVPVKFCQIHGVEGVPVKKEIMDDKKNQETKESKKDLTTGLVCPNCHKPIPKKFCPECGIEGVLPANEK